VGVDSKVTAKGQTTIPLEIREFLKIGPGDRIRFVIIDGRVEIIPRNRPASDLFGKLAHYGIPGTTLEDYDRALDLAFAERDENMRAKAAGKAA
jgi:antitoxin PrlF